MEARDKRIIDLFCAGTAVSDICQIIGVKKTTVYKVKKRFSDHGQLGRRPGSGGQATARTKRLIQSIRGKIQRNPVRSMRQMAKEASVSEATVRRIVKYDLKAKSRAILTRHSLPGDSKLTRLQRCKKILSILKKKKSPNPASFSQMKNCLPLTK